MTTRLASLRGDVEALRIGPRETDGLLDEHMFAGAEREGRMLEMVLVGAKHEHHVDGGIGDQRLGVGMTPATCQRAATRFATDGDTSVTFVTVNRSLSRVSVGRCMSCATSPSPMIPTPSLDM